MAKKLNDIWENNKFKLRCIGYDIKREVSALVEMNVQFVLIANPRNSELIAESFKKLELYLSNDIDIVIADPSKPRCYYCGQLNTIDVTSCTYCGGRL